MDDDALSQFTSITGASATTATQYFQLAEGQLDSALELYFANDGAALEQTAQPSNSPPVPPASSRPSASNPPTQPQPHSVIEVDSDQEYQPGSDDEVQITGTTRRGIGSLRSEGALHTPPVATPPAQPTMDDDEAMARRLQEEFYGAGGAGAGVGSNRAETLDEEGYRAPIQRTTETLVGPDSFDPTNQEEMRAAVAEQMMLRRQARQQRDRPGIFNQSSESVWGSSDAANSRDTLARSTGGASEASAKASSLAEMYRPPFELISRLRWEDARTEGKENQKWILINIQDPSIFDCQLLNRDIWKNPSITETVKENFIFLQYSKDDQRGNQYTQYYFQNKDSESAYPHIAIVDPRTGEQVKKWSGPPAPKAPDFLMQLHEFLDRYSLSATAKNPVARRKPEVKQATDLGRLTEEQQLEMAMQASLAGAPSEDKPADDPDDLTRSIGHVQAPASSSNNLPSTPDPDTLVSPPVNGLSSPAPPSLLSTISATNPHVEPPPTEPNITRIQFRHPSGRVVRRFALSDSVRRIYEWLRATPIDGTEGKEFELVFMQKNLIESLEDTVEGAGLKNGTVMVEVIDGDG